jgi:hypothetical protein
LINISEEYKTLHLFSDNCPGQNKNISMVQFLYSLTASGRFLKIHLHFPEGGHSFMPCDWAFAQTEKIKRRKEYVFVPGEWYDIVSFVLKKFSVVRVDQGTILDSKPHLQPFFKKMIKNNTASFITSRYRTWFTQEEKSGYPLSRIIRFAASSASRQSRTLLILMHQKNTKAHCL